MLYRPVIEDLSLEVADCAYGETVYKQKVHQVDVSVPIGGAGLIALQVWLTAYARNADGSYGAPLPADRVPVRPVPLIAVPTCAVEPSGRVRFRLGVPGQVLDVVTGQVLTLPPGQDWLGFLDAHADTLLLQDEAMKFKRDNDQLCVRAFAESQVRAADLAPSSFA